MDPHMLSDISFVWPWMALAWPLPWLVRRFAPARATAFALAVPSAPTDLAPANAPGAAAVPVWAWLAWTALVIAALRPEIAGEPVVLPAEGRDIMLAVDISGSMNEEDVVWNGQVRSRLAVVQAAAGDFLRGRRGDRIGLVLFGESAHLYTPLSLDTITAADMLHEVEVGLAGQKTAIGDALAIAIEHLLDASEADERVIVLLTDGENNAGDISPEKAASLAGEAGIRIHTIGLDGEGAGRRGLFDALTRRGVDARQLQRIAELADGRSFVARGGRSLQEVYTELDRIEARPVAEEVRLPPRSGYWLPLLAALLLSLPLVRLR